MIERQLGPSRKIRIWVGQVPNLTSDFGEYVTYSLVAPASVDRRNQLVGVELLIRAGPRSLYGFLVGEFSPIESEELTIKMATTEKLGDVVEWALPRNTDQVFAGLPAEYAKSVIQGIIDMDTVNLLRSGVLQFDHAAHSLVGSSGDVFRRLTHVVVYLLSNQGDLPDNDKICDLLELR